MAGYQNDVCVSFAHTGGNSADTHLGDELDVHACGRVRVLQVVDELLEILDRIDVVVWRRRDQPDPGRGMPGLGDPWVDLAARQLAALPRLRALRHLDLEVVGVREVVAGDTEAAARDLLDGRPSPRVVQPV